MIALRLIICIVQRPLSQRYHLIPETNKINVPNIHSTSPRKDNNNWQIEISQMPKMGSLIPKFEWSRAKINTLYQVKCISTLTVAMMLILKELIDLAWIQGVTTNVSFVVNGKLIGAKSYFEFINGIYKVIC